MIMSKEFEEARAKLDALMARMAKKRNESDKRIIAHAERSKNQQWKNNIAKSKQAQADEISQQMKHAWATEDREEIKSKIADTVTNLWDDEEYRDMQRHARDHVYSVPENCGNFKSAIVATNIETGKELRFLGARAMKAAGFEPGNVYRCLAGRTKSHKGYTWRREE